MPRLSAGFLAYRRTGAGTEVLLVHPGGPYWRNRDLGAWSIPKGEHDETEDPLAAAVRECREELGAAPEPGPERESERESQSESERDPSASSSGTPAWIPLTPVKQKGGKIVRAWGVAWDWDPATLVSNTFTMEWPPRSGRTEAFPEVDRARWFPLDEALRYILDSQRPLVEELARRLED